MNDIEFCILVALLLWNAWRTRTAANTPPRLRDHLLHRIFQQLNSIEARQRRVPVAQVELEAQEWWAGVRAIEEVQPKGWPFWPRAQRPAYGPWHRPDWNTRGVARIDELRQELQREEGDGHRDDFERLSRLVEGEPDNPEHLCRLAVYYRAGHGVVRDPNKAEALYTSALELGSAEACHYFAAKHFNGDGVPANEKEAYFWETLSVALGGRSTWLDQVDRFATLSLEDRSETESSVRRWVEDHSPDPK